MLQWKFQATISCVTWDLIDIAVDVNDWLQLIIDWSDLEQNDFWQSIYLKKFQLSPIQFQYLERLDFWQAPNYILRNVSYNTLAIQNTYLYNFMVKLVSTFKFL